MEKKVSGNYYSGFYGKRKEDVNHYSGESDGRFN